MGLAGIDDLSIASTYFAKQETFVGGKSHRQSYALGNYLYHPSNQHVFTVVAPGESLDLRDHLLNNGVIEWLATAASNPDQFPAEFERLAVPT